MCPLCFDSNDAAGDTRRNTTGVPQHLVAKAEPAWASKGDSIPLMPWRLSSGVLSLEASAVRRPSGRDANGLREMITLKHVVAGRIPTNLGPSAEGWTRTVMIFLVIVVVAGIVAMWNRSRYRP
jgi:hypothetical protein